MDGRLRCTSWPVGVPRYSLQLLWHSGRCTPLACTLSGVSENFSTHPATLRVRQKVSYIRLDARPARFLCEIARDIPEAPEGTVQPKTRDWEARNDNTSPQHPSATCSPRDRRDKHPHTRGKSLVRACLRDGRMAPSSAGRGAGAHTEQLPKPPCTSPTARSAPSPARLPLRVLGGWFYTWAVGEVQVELGEHARCTNK